MTRADACDVADASARMALDQAADYHDSVASFRENLTDTLADAGVTDLQTWGDALDAFDARIAAALKESQA